MSNRGVEEALNVFDLRLMARNRLPKWCSNLSVTRTRRQRCNKEALCRAGILWFGYSRPR